MMVTDRLVPMMVTNKVNTRVSAYDGRRQGLTDWSLRFPPILVYLRRCGNELWQTNLLKGIYMAGKIVFLISM